MQDKLLAVRRRVNSFLSKQYKENEPLNLVRQDDDFKKFKTDLETAIMAQALWTASKFKSLSVEYIARDLQPMSLEQQAMLLVFLENNMPTVADSIDSTTLTNWFTKAFSAGAKSVYITNNVPVDFKLTNQGYLNAIANDADFLLNRSTLDETTRKGLIQLIADDREAGMTRAEIAQDIQDKFEEISATRAEMIADTETSGMLSRGQHAAMKESGIAEHAWLTLGANPCAVICELNAGDDFIPIDQPFSSGDVTPPGHPRCECSEDYQNLDFSELTPWEGE